jgi:hypothetical protein
MRWPEPPPQTLWHQVLNPIFVFLFWAYLAVAFLRAGGNDWIGAAEMQNALLLAGMAWCVMRVLVSLAWKRFAEAASSVLVLALIVYVEVARPTVRPFLYWFFLLPLTLATLESVTSIARYYGYLPARVEQEHQTEQTKVSA